MRNIGLGLLAAGFVWMIFDTTSSFVSYQHLHWIIHSKSLPAGETISKGDATAAMRELSLNLKNRHRYVLLPGTLMLTGGLCIYFAPGTRKAKQQAEG